ncbi:hypothetical protein CHO01_08930 [Cellulomonas hominis]|uniref:Uncharacterized protein n=1 Tax=Cellulomonas hominis TaxID=156981 RepID=A0A511FBU8_9CELL|nr:hypothetical protein [Cellulomonas hominis]MBB5471936.1 hypothetical protein [Cellulomonas hominis]GEL45777.1 hypothetical protein CHO01_08930 [Cellulomonas hominis]
MSGLLAVAHGALLQAAGDPSPSPSTIEIPPEDQTSPGLLGFLVTFAVAAAVIALGFSLVRHLRVVDRNARRLEAEEAAAAAGSTPGTPGTPGSPDAPRADGPDGPAAPTPPGPATPPPGDRP